MDKTKPRCPYQRTSHSRKQEEEGPDFGQPRNHLAEILRKAQLILQMINKQKRSQKVLARARAIKGIGKKVLKGTDLAGMSDKELLKKMEVGEFDNIGQEFQHRPAPNGKELAKLSDEEFLQKMEG